MRTRSPRSPTVFSSTGIDYFSTQVTNGASATVTYGYGPDSNLTCVSYPNASNNTCASSVSDLGIVSYTYNSSDQLTDMYDWAGNTFYYNAYNANGQPTNLSINASAGRGGHRLRHRRERLLYRRDGVERGDNPVGLERHAQP